MAYRDYELSQNAYDRFRVLLEGLCGIVLGGDKQYLVTTRLTPLLNEFGFSTIDDLLNYIHRDPRPATLHRVVEAMTTKETSWFRDRSPFELLQRHVLPIVAKSQPRRLKVWSAACSYGQETHSINIAVEEFLRLNPKQLPEPTILGTDISAEAIKSARRGVYTERDLDRGLSPERRKLFFDQVDDGWAVNRQLARRVSFVRHNLLDDYASFGHFQIILCRNVLIYFSPETKADILERLAGALVPGGFLLLGASEHPGFGSKYFEQITFAGTGVAYRRKSLSTVEQASGNTSQS
ncbi:MAG: protein-glutamate O-methyltransferase CheR [Pseudomonadota bacterium]|nr:protein-glutamate O-methyltransferase CheR [Pseudomonadota bacterium]